MEEVLRDVQETEVYIIGVFGEKSFEEHLLVLERVLKRLEDNNFTINPLKCEWCVQETDFLGFWLTPQGLKPWRKKIQAILDLEQPKNVSEVRDSCLSYRLMSVWRKMVLLLATLLELDAALLLFDTGTRFPMVEVSHKITKYSRLESDHR